MFTDNVQYFEDLDLKTESKRSTRDNNDNKEEEDNDELNKAHNYDSGDLSDDYQENEKIVYR